MIKAPARLSVKLNLRCAPDFDAAACIPVFHQWIRDNSLDELLIDVVDYRHVNNGPGILLVGLEADYGIEEVDGRFGLRYTRKRSMPPALTEALLLAYRQAVHACASIGREPSTAGSLPSTHAGVEFNFFDRLWYPNTPDSYPALLGEIAPLFASVYGGSRVEAEFVGSDERRPLAVRLIGDPPPFDVLKRRLDELAADRSPVLHTE